MKQVKGEVIAKVNEQQQAPGESIDANKVINKLTQQNGDLSRKIAILEVQFDELYSAYEKQREVIEAYEEDDTSDDSSENTPD